MRTEAVLVTNEYINEFKTKRGAWTRAQIIALGLTWPPQHGWKNSIIGEVITGQQAEAFESNNTPISKGKKKKAKQNVISEIDLCLCYLEKHALRMTNKQMKRHRDIEVKWLRK